MHPITAIIPTKNEAANIGEAIRAVSWANEIIIIDSFSTDDTLTIAQQYPVKIVQRAFDTHARQKNYAIAQATHNWIFILDADERLPENLISEIKNLLASPQPLPVAFWIKKRKFLYG